MVLAVAPTTSAATHPQNAGLIVNQIVIQRQSAASTVHRACRTVHWGFAARNLGEIVSQNSR